MVPGLRTFPFGSTRSNAHLWDDRMKKYIRGNQKRFQSTHSVFARLCAEHDRKRTEGATQCKGICLQRLSSVGGQVGRNAASMHWGEGGRKRREMWKKKKNWRCTTRGQLRIGGGSRRAHGSADGVLEMCETLLTSFPGKWSVTDTLWCLQNVAH